MLEGVKKNKIVAADRWMAFNPEKCLKRIDGNLLRLFVIMMLVFAMMAVIVPNPFLTLGNFGSMAFQIPEFGIIAIAMMLTMISGGIDLSIVGTANLAGILSALVLVRLTPENASTGQVILIILAAVLLALAVGIVCGLANGLMISKVGIPPMLATLGSMQLFMGVAIIISKGQAVLGFPSQFAVLGNGSIGWLPVPMMIFILIAVLFAIILNKSALGLKLYMMGTNPKASLFSGINNTKILIQTYIMSGMLGAMGGIILIARTNSAKADYGVSYTLQAVLVAVMGGVNPQGGFGRISGIIMAMLTLQFLSSGFNALHFSNFFKDFTWGAVLIIVMVMNYVLDGVKQRKSMKKAA